MSPTPEPQQRPQRRRLWPHLLFALILSGVMSCVVSGIATFRTLGPDLVQQDWLGFAFIWLRQNWLPSWLTAFPIVLVLAPAVRRLVTRLAGPF